MIWKCSSIGTVRGLAGTAIFLCLATTCFSQVLPSNCAPTNSVVLPETSAPQGIPLKVLAFGTSLMWDNGVTNQHSFRYLVAKKLSADTSRRVALTTFAHSAALLGVPEPGTKLEGDASWNLGDLNSSEPTVHDQIECAAGSANTAEADLILVDGCINEVGAESIPLPWTQKDELRKRINAACGEMMKIELTHLAQRYPRAIVIVVGYYPLVSRQSITGWFRGTERLKKHVKKTYMARHQGVPLPTSPRRTREGERDNMADNSEFFYQHSKKKLNEAVDFVNANVTHSGQMIFAPLPEVTLPDGTKTVDPDFAFGAPKHRLWWVPIPLVWHWAFFADEKYGIRHDECHKVRNLEEKLICPVNVAFHPNQEGAKMYSDSILRVIPPDTIDRWRTATRATESGSF